MAVPAEQVILVNSDGQALGIEALVEQLRDESNRILADDEVGLVLYVGDLGIYSMKPTDGGEFLGGCPRNPSGERSSGVISRSRHTPNGTYRGSGVQSW